MLIDISKAEAGYSLQLKNVNIEQHGGTLAVANSPATGGGMVSIEI